MAKLIVFTGYLGTGKSTLAQRLAAETNWRLLQIDKLRRIMIPQPDYNDEEMENMYRVMLAAAEAWLKRGFDVILDATFSKPIYHYLLRKLVERARADLKVIFCVCSDEEATKRLVRRMRERKSDAADTTVEKYFAHKGRFKLIDFWPVKKLNTENHPEIVFKKLKEYLNLNGEKYFAQSAQETRSGFCPPTQSL